jgi:hypothetical protein
MTYSLLIKLLWALFGLDICLSPVNAALCVDIDCCRYIDKVKQLNSRLSLLLGQIDTGLETADFKRLPIEERKVGQSQSERRLSVRLAPAETPFELQTPNQTTTGCSNR